MKIPFKAIICRALVYQFAIFLAVNQLLQTKDYISIFRNKIFENLTKLHITNHYVNTIGNFLVSTDKFPLIYKASLVSMIFFSILAIVVNCAFSKFTVSFLFFFYSMVNYSPLLAENKIKSTNKYGIRNEFVLCFGIWLGMVMMIFKQSCSCKCAKVEPKKDIQTQKETKKEESKQQVKEESSKIEVEMTQTKKEASNSGKKKKRKH